jgi:Ca-activated chloride channel family protein
MMRWSELNRTLLVYTLGLPSVLGACAVDDQYDDEGASPYAYGGSPGPSPDPRPAPPVVDQSGENYGAVQVNAFVETEGDPLATFAVDVDTGSYTLMRRDVLQGQPAVPGGVRVEEYVNFFKYADPSPAPESDDPFASRGRAVPFW